MPVPDPPCWPLSPLCPSHGLRRRWLGDARDRNRGWNKLCLTLGHSVTPHPRRQVIVVPRGRGFLFRRLQLRRKRGFRSRRQIRYGPCVGRQQILKELGFCLFIRRCPLCQDGGGWPFFHAVCRRGNGNRRRRHSEGLPKLIDHAGDAEHCGDFEYNEQEGTHNHIPQPDAAGRLSRYSQTHRTCNRGAIRQVQNIVSPTLPRRQINMMMRTLIFDTRYCAQKLTVD